MAYIQRMRKLIGHEPLMLVGAAVLVMLGGRLLMMRRTDNHAWGIPGGALELGESSGGRCAAGNVGGDRVGSWRSQTL